MLNEKLGAVEQVQEQELKPEKDIEAEFIIDNKTKYIVVGIVNDYGETMLDYEEAQDGTKYVVFSAFKNYEKAARELSEITDDENDEYIFERSCCDRIFIHCPEIQ